MLKSYVFAQTKFQDAKDRLAGLTHDEDGAALIEYSLLLGLIAVAVITIIGTVGGTTLAKWTAFSAQYK